MDYNNNYNFLDDNNNNNNDWIYYYDNHLFEYGNDGSDEEEGCHLVKDDNYGINHHLCFSYDNNYNSFKINCKSSFNKKMKRRNLLNINEINTNTILLFDNNENWDIIYHKNKNNFLTK